MSIEVCEVPAQAISLPPHLLSPVNLLVDESGGAGQADLVVLEPHLAPVSGPPLACSRRRGGTGQEAGGRRQEEGGRKKEARRNRLGGFHPPQREASKIEEVTMQGGKGSRAEYPGHPH